MAGISSNYINSITNQYRYNYNNLNSQYNNAPLVYGSRSQNSNYVNSGAMSYLSSITSSAKKLNDSLGEIAQNSSFNQLSAISSNTESLSINSSSKLSENFGSIAVEVEQVATTQKNDGAAMKSNAAYGNSGSQTFEIEVNGIRKQISVNVDYSDTNKDVQQKMADAINSANVGVRASVKTDASKGTSTLSLSSVNTGEDVRNQFTVRDRTGSLVSRTGIGNVTQEAQDSIYYVDGNRLISSSNSVDLGHGVSATLKKATTEEINVTVGISNDYAKNKVKELVDNYNQLLYSAKTSTNGNARLENDLATAFQSYSSSLEKIGIKATADGSLSIDSAKLNEAAENGKLEQFFTENSKNNYGFTNRLATITRNVANSPANYVNNPESQKAYTPINPYDTSNDPNFMSSLLNSSSFNLKAYNQWYSMGYLFDMFA